MNRLYVFAIALVLYEFTAYSASDMIMPGMIQVVKDFNVSHSYVAEALIFYLLGNATFLLVVGFLAERFGKKRIMVLGNTLFLVTTILIAFSHSIVQFMLLRFLQGGGLSIIAIGYGLIHEIFNDEDAVKLIALMSNVSLLAPLLGPAVGSAIVSYQTWHSVFVILAFFSAVTLLGLYKFTPEKTDHVITINFSNVVDRYWQILQSKNFLQGAFCVVLASMPMFFWIGQSPNLLLYKLHLNYLQYSICQIAGIGGLTISSVLMQFVAGKFRIYTLIKVGASLVLFGLLLSLAGYQYIEGIVFGFFVYTFGLGLSNACTFRLLMSNKDLPSSMVSSMIAFLQTLLYAIGVSASNSVFNHFDYNTFSFTLSSFVFGVTAYLLINRYNQYYRERKWE